MGEAKAERQVEAQMAATTRQTMRTLAPLLLLSGCVSAERATTTTQPPPSALPARPVGQSALGLEGVMGRTAPALVGRFGTPSLDVREGSARKLQFASGVCVLDVYLYPRAGGGEAVVTHIDARFPDGRDLDRASCVASFGR